MMGRISKQVGTKDAANEVAKQLEARLALGEDVFIEKKKKIMPLFKDFAEGFMDAYSAMNHKRATQDSYRSALDRHILPFFGDMPLDSITRKDVKDFINEKNISELAPASVRNFKVYLSGILSEAVDDEIIQFNPVVRTGKLIKKKANNEKIDPFTWEEKAIFEAAIKKHFPRYYPLFLTALRTGMRLGELIVLQPGDLDFNGKFIDVRRSCVRGHISTSKSDKSRRVDMTDGLVETLQKHMTDRKRESLEKGWGDSTGLAVF